MKDNNESIIIHDDYNAFEEKTVDSIFELKALVTVFSVFSVALLVLCIIILILGDLWFLMLILRLVFDKQYSWVTINIPLMLLSTLLFVRVLDGKNSVGKLLSFIVTLLIVLMIPILSFKADKLVSGSYTLFFIPIYVIEAINTIFRIQTFFVGFSDFKKHREVLGNIFSLFCLVLSDLLRVLSEVFLLFSFQSSMEQFYRDYLWFGIAFSLSLVMYLLSFVLLRQSRTYTGIALNIVRIVVVIYLITQCLMLVTNTGIRDDWSFVIILIPTYLLFGIIHICYIIIPILYTIGI
ncbi:Transmembrane protein [Entamoeba marina]